MKKGYVRARVDGEILYLEDEIELDKNKKHNVEVVVDRLVFKEEDKEFIGRLTQGIENAVELAEGNVIINIDIFFIYFLAYQNKKISRACVSNNYRLGTCPIRPLYSNRPFLFHCRR